MNMPKKIDTANIILDVATELLKTEGDHGISMRKVATLAQLSLSNVQYYFKNKNTLLTAIADRYLRQCLDDLKQQPSLKHQDELEPFIRSFLTQAHETSDMCRIFKEYWAIASKNPEIQEYIDHYYQEVADTLSEKWRLIALDTSSAQMATAIFLPYFEGYTITVTGLSLDLEIMSQVVSDIVWQYLSGKNI